MRILKKTLAYTLSLGMILTTVPGCQSADKDSTSAYTTTIPTAVSASTSDSQGPLKGFVIQSQNNKDFPSASNLSSNALNQEISDITAYTKALGGNAVFFQVRSQGEALYNSKIFPRSQFFVEEQGDFTFYDPFKQFLSAAKKENLGVYAMVNPFYLGETTEGLASSSPLVRNAADCVNIDNKYYFSPNSDYGVSANLSDLSRLADKYNPAGIVLTGIDDYNLLGQPEYFNRLLSLIDGLKKELKNTTIGVEITSAYLTDAQITALSEKLDLVLVNVAGSTDYNANEFEKQLAYYENLIGADRTIPLLSPNTEAENDLVFQSYLLTKQGKSIAYHGYQALKNPTTHLGAKITSLSTQTPDYILNYTPDATLKITHPRENYRTNTSKFYVTGTSDPSLPLTVDGKEIERTTSNGSFGVLLELDMGKNIFTFQQGDTTVKYPIERYVPSEAPVTTNKITKMYPESFGVAFAGEELTISCIAPSGSSVSATINGKTYNLKQAVATAANSIPATYRATITLTEEVDALKNLGQITYNLTHAGKNSSYTSNGSLYFAPKGAKLYGEVINDTQSVYPTNELTGDYLRIYREGTIEELTEFGTNYVKTLSEGYLPNASVKLLAESAVNPIHISGAELKATDDSVSFILKGGAGIPYSLVDDSNGEYVLTLYSPNAIQELALPYSEVFSNVSANYDNTSAYEIRFTTSNPSAIWGYDVFYNGDDAEVFFKLAPKKSEDPLQPLKHVTVVLDPGHGGTDIGAPGALRTIGPSESSFNLATSHAIRDQLERLGATVIMTRSGDATMSLTERAKITRNNLPHISLSVHYNSHAETTDGNKVAGIETYYHFQNAKILAETIGNKMTSSTGRSLRWSNSGNYIVTKYSFTTAALLETGYMPNPKEYTQTMSAFEMFKTGVAVADAFTDYVEKYGRA